MTIFWILVAGLAGLALLFVLTPLLSSSANSAEQTDDVDLDQVNLDLFKQQLAELDADLAAGKLDQAQYESARQDLEREAISNVDGAKVGSARVKQPNAALPSARLTALALLVAVPAATLALYQLVGNQALIPQLNAGAAGQFASSTGHSGAPDGMPPLDELVAQLEQRMQQTPEDVEGWIMLGRTYFALGDPAKAEGALAEAYAKSPDDAEVLLAYAEALAANNGNSLEGRPSELVSQALALDPEDVTARWLSGMVAFQRGQFTSAAVAWKTVLSKIDPSSEDADELRKLIDNAEQRAGVPAAARLVAQAAAPGPEPDAAGATAPNEPAAAAASDAVQPEPATMDQPPADTAAVDVAVSLAPALAARATPETTVFVYAKAAAGPPMPLAVQRVTVADLPATLRLDDSMAMMPAMKLSSFPQIIVGARVSPSGQAMPQPGDLEGETGPIPSIGSPQVAITIDRVRP
ncbi:MAG: c-type cytochrome biogenesis protein CcmI [Thiohalocapsa sp.]